MSARKLMRFVAADGTKRSNAGAIVIDSSNVVAMYNFTDGVPQLTTAAWSQQISPTGAGGIGTICCAVSADGLVMAVAWMDTSGSDGVNYPAYTYLRIYDRVSLAATWNLRFTKQLIEGISKMHLSSDGAFLGVNKSSNVSFGSGFTSTIYRLGATWATTTVVRNWSYNGTGFIGRLRLHDNISENRIYFVHIGNNNGGTSYAHEFGYINKATNAVTMLWSDNGSYTSGQLISTSTNVTFFNLEKTLLIAEASGSTLKAYGYETGTLLYKYALPNLDGQYGVTGIPSPYAGGHMSPDDTLLRFTYQSTTDTGADIKYRFYSRQTASTWATTHSQTYLAPQNPTPSEITADNKFYVEPDSGRTNLRIYPIVKTGLNYTRGAQLLTKAMPKEFKFITTLDVGVTGWD